MLVQVKTWLSTQRIVLKCPPVGNWLRTRRPRLPSREQVPTEMELEDVEPAKQETSPEHVVSETLIIS